MDSAVVIYLAQHQLSPPRWCSSQHCRGGRHPRDRASRSRPSTLCWTPIKRWFRKPSPPTRGSARTFPRGSPWTKLISRTISTLQRYVKTADLDKVYEAVGKVLADERPASWKLTAYKYYFLPWKNIGLAGIVIRQTDDLRRFQQKLIDAIAPFTVKTGTAAPFVTTKEDPDINKPTIDYVAHYVPADSGAKFNPHVTIGVASQDFLKELLKEKFDEFTFSPSGVSVYHLGNFGTAREKLKSWVLT